MSVSAEMSDSPRAATTAFVAALLIASLSMSAVFARDLDQEGHWNSNWPSSQQELFSRFETAVTAHDWGTVLSELLHPEYVRQQHDTWIEGRTDQFLSELLFPSLWHEKLSETCQTFLEQSSHAQRISSIESLSVEGVEDRMVRISVSISSSECRFEHRFASLVEKDEGGVVAYLFYGPVG